MFERRCAYSSRISCSRGEMVGEWEVGGGAGGVEVMVGMSEGEGIWLFGRLV